jgi:inorganic triphosphatase YgiF
MNTPPLETELRLAATPSALVRLPRAHALADVQVSAPTEHHLVSTYWDTPTHSLRSAGIGVRTRWNGHAWVQTVKFATASNATRQEFETPVAKNEPRLADAVAAGAKVDVHLGADGPLQPLFRSEVHRITHRLRFVDGTVAELARDDGRLVVERSDGAELPISEIELELESGDVRRIYELAFALVSEIPRLRVLVATKAERGYALLTGAGAPPRKARPLTTARGCSAATLTVAAATEALGHIEGNIEGARTASDADFVHQMRVGVRRLRVTTTMAKASGLPTFSPRLERELKWLWKTLGNARDWDVLQAETWPALRGPTQEQLPATTIDERISRARSDSHRKLLQALHGRRFQRMILALGWVIENQHAAVAAHRKPRGARAGRKLLDRTLQRLCEQADAIDAVTGEQRHGVRIEAKKLRYLGEFFSGTYRRKRAERFLRRLSKVQDVLGGLNDLDMARTLMQSLRGTADEKSFVANALRGHATAAESALHLRLERAWKKVAGTRPFWT